MALKELNSFIFKFNQLWHSGMSAHLDLDTHAGEAWVGLRVRLGQAPFPPQEAFSNLPRTRDSPARQRRRARRATAREQEQVEQTVAQAEETVVPTENVVSNTENDEETEEQTHERAEEATIEEEINVVDDSVKDTNELAAAEVEIVEMQVEVDKEVVKESNVKKVETVYAVAEFENLPNGTLMQDDLKSLEKYLFCEKHLEDNIENYEYQVKSNFEVSLKLNVKTDRLWETTRQYLWKHLGGNNYWDRQNGTRIRIKRIHLK